MDVEGGVSHEYTYTQRATIAWFTKDSITLLNPLSHFEIQVSVSQLLGSQKIQPPLSTLWISEFVYK